jgi:hypothetical protein
VRIDVVERLGDAVAADPSAADAALAQIVGRPAREIAEILHALGYRRKPEAEGQAVRWRRIQPRRKQLRSGSAGPNPFSELANLLPPTAQPPRKRRGRNRPA